MKRVVITGQGTINALGQNVAETLEGFRRGRLGIGELDVRDVGRLSIRIGAQIRNFRAEDHFDRRQIGLYDRFTQLAMIAAREAIAQSGLTFDDALGERTGVIIGTAGGGLQTQDETYRAVFADGRNRVHPLVVPRLMNSAAVGHLSIAFNLRGPGYTVSTACASSNHAMGQAFNMVRSGLCAVAITGGTDSMLCFGGIKAWEGLRVMSPDACRPFSRGRNGMVQGEGAAIFVFEEFEHARARDAEILAEVAGFAMTSDAGDIVKPSIRGAARAIAGAICDARLSSADIGYVNAHGTGTMLNDRTECAALRDVLGTQSGQVPVSSTKSMHGHAMGGTGAIELLAVIMALRSGVIAPTISYLGPDPECPLDVVPGEAREATVTAALSNAFAFGGLNAVLALRRV